MSKKNNNNWGNHASSRMLPQSTSNQINNLKRLKLIPLFVLFHLDVEDKKRLLAPKSRKDKLKKLMTCFSESKHISMFSKPVWFAYRSPNKLEKVAK